MQFQRFLQTILAAVALTALFFLLELVFGQVTKGTALVWNLLANLLIVAVLGGYVVQSGFHSRRLWLATFAIFYVIGSFNIVIEAFIFGVADNAMMIKSVLFGVPYTLIGSYLIILIFGQHRETTRLLPLFHLRKTFGWIWRILAANFLYVLFYLIAGTLVEMYTPGFTEFYEGKLPSMEVFFMTNMGFRGFVFVAIAILMDRSLNAGSFVKALLVGLVFSIIGGVAPLIPANEEMPQFIRIAHGYEVGISNFFYGICVFLLIRSRVKIDEKSVH